MSASTRPKWYALVWFGPCPREWWQRPTYRNALLAMLLGALSGCVDKDGARSALRGAGYTDVVLTGYQAFTCGRDDNTCTGFRARGPSGAAVTGAVGCGFACKGCTIRLEVQP
jgi:hypothetical protein